MDRTESDGRAVSPVVAGVAMVGVVVLLAAVATVVLGGLTEEREPSPDVTFSMEPGDVAGEQRIVHEGGDTLDGDKVEVRGVADPDALAGERFDASDNQTVVPTQETVRLVWYGDHGTSYVLWEFDVDPSAIVPPPDEGCDWVNQQAPNGVSDITIDGIVVNCDVVTEKVIEVRNGGGVIGDTDSTVKKVKATDAAFYGTVDATKQVKLLNSTVTGPVESHTDQVILQDGATVEDDITAQKPARVEDGSTVSGSVTSTDKQAKVLDSTVTGGVVSQTSDVKIENGTVGGDVSGGKVIDVTNGSTVGGDVIGDGKDVKVLDSTVEGTVVNDGTVKLTDATVEGEVYAGDLDCTGTNSTVAGQDCGDYDPRDPDDY